MPNNKYKGRGWHGDSRGHSLAARGISLYKKKNEGMSSFFLAQQKEEQVPFSRIKDMVEDGWSLDKMMDMHPDVDKEDMRKRGIKAIESVEGSNTLSVLNSNGVDMTVNMAKSSERFRQNAVSVLNDPQKSSFIPEAKVRIIKGRLEDL